MERTKSIGQIYAYVVCLASVITFIVTLSVIINSIFDYARPANSNNFRYASSGRDVTSFETYKASGSALTKDDSTTPTISDAELKIAYQDARQSQIDTVKFGAVKGMVTSGLLLLFAIGLFWSHWRLAKSYSTLA
jgi:hypothetical protein